VKTSLFEDIFWAKILFVFGTFDGLSWAILTLKLALALGNGI
jgi:hypothetical protein